MRTSRFHAAFLEELLRQKTISTMPELQCALGTKVPATVFRKLKELDYLTSYSHRGRYYALSDMAHFDEQGLWSFRDVRFSRYGTLLATLEALVNASEAGYFATELEAVVGVGVDDALARLVRQSRLSREKVTGRLSVLCNTDSHQTQATQSAQYPELDSEDSAKRCCLR